MADLYWVIYDPATGRIVGSYHGPAQDMELQRQHWPDMSFAATDRTRFDPAVEMVTTGMGGSPVVVPRPTLPGFNKSTIIADGVDTARLKRLPPGITATVDGGDHVLADGILEITATMPATYSVAINHWPYQAFTATIVAT